MYTYIEEKNLLRKEQGGFRKGYRTIDHIFTLLTLVNKHLSKGEKLYACFVDLKKAYDSVWRDGLFYKLQKLGIDKKTTNIIENMYKNTSTSIIYKNQLLPKILVTKGLKQGDNLSPILFNLYINDLPEYISQGKTDPVYLMNQEVNCLMWADDLILLSRSPEGLQKCVKNLTEYCQKWKLEINMKKTKVLTFNKSGKILKSVRIFANKTLLKNVNQYTYLGFTVASSGTLSHGINNLIDKAKRAWFSIKNIFYKSRSKNISTYTVLFDYVIKPIMLYACEIWGTNIKTGYSACFDNNSIETFHLRFCKNMLGVHRGTSNIGTLAEIGRYPLATEIHKRMVRYLLRFKILNENTLVAKAFREQETENNKTLWLTQTRTFLDEIGMNMVHTKMKEMNNKESDFKRISKMTYDREKETFEQKVWHEIDSKMEKSKGKLLFFGKLKHRYGYEKYLNIPNVLNRQAISQIRLSAHKLEIEMGRYQEIGKRDRICQYCRSGEVESEYHFIAVCPNYKDIRGKFREELIKHDETYINLGWSYILDILFTKNDLKALNLLGQFLRRCWERRELMGCNLTQ